MPFLITLKQLTFSFKRFFKRGNMNTYNKPNIFPSSTILNTNATSIALQLEDMYGYSIQVAFSGGANGQFKLQASSDPVPKQTIPTPSSGYVANNWTDITGSTALTPTVVASTGNIMWNYTGSQYDFVRVQYQDNSGGASTAVIVSSVFNGKGS